MSRTTNLPAMSRTNATAADNQTQRLLTTIKNLQGALRLASDTIMFLADGHVAEGREEAQGRAAGAVMALNTASAKAQLSTLPVVDLSCLEEMREG